MRMMLSSYFPCSNFDINPQLVFKILFLFVIFQDATLARQNAAKMDIFGPCAAAHFLGHFLVRCQKMI